MDRLNFLKKKRASTEPEPKRISTPAGLRLSTILENGGPTQIKHNKSVSRLSWSVLVEDPNEAKEGASSHNYSCSAVSEKSPLPSPALTKRFKTKEQITKRGGWKRLLLLGLISLCLVAVIVGLAVGLKKNHSNRSNSTNQAQSENGSSTTSASSAAATSGTLASNSTLPKDFPIGSYSMITFLDTVTTNCTSNAATWTCFPYTIYNDDHMKAEATFNWLISAGSTSGSYQISSTDNPFAINFKNAPMTLVDAGKDSERYTFHVTFDKVVQPSASITSDNSAATCFFNSTSFQGYLYTKRAKEYPPNGHSTGATYQEWPFAVRAEEVIGGGDNTPNCYKTVNGNLGDKITKGITAQDPGNLCDCLYRNWLTSMS